MLGLIFTLRVFGQPVKVSWSESTEEVSTPRPGPLSRTTSDLKITLIIYSQMYEASQLPTPLPKSTVFSPNEAIPYLFPPQIVACSALLWANNATPAFVREGRQQCVHETGNVNISISCSNWCNRKHQCALPFLVNLKELPANTLSWWNWWLTRWAKVHFGDLPIVCHSLMLSSPWLPWASWGASCSPHVGRQLFCICERRHSCEWWTRNR